MLERELNEAKEEITRLKDLYTDTFCDFKMVREERDQWKAMAEELAAAFPFPALTGGNAGSIAYIVRTEGESGIPTEGLAKHLEHVSECLTKFSNALTRFREMISTPTPTPTQPNQDHNL